MLSLAAPVWTRTARDQCRSNRERMIAHSAIAATACKAKRTRLAQRESVRNAAAMQIMLTQRQRAANHSDRIHGDRSPGCSKNWTGTLSAAIPAATHAQTRARVGVAAMVFVGTLRRLRSGCIERKLLKSRRKPDGDVAANRPAVACNRRQPVAAQRAARRAAHRARVIP